jgi:hypothetical protein
VTKGNAEDIDGKRFGGTDSGGTGKARGEENAGKLMEEDG